MRLAILLGAGLLLATSAVTQAHTPRPEAIKPDVHVHVATAASFHQTPLPPKHVPISPVCTEETCAPQLFYKLCLADSLATPPHVHADAQRVAGPAKLPATPPPRVKKY